MLKIVTIHYRSQFVVYSVSDKSRKWGPGSDLSVAKYNLKKKIYDMIINFSNSPVEIGAISLVKIST